MSVITTFSCPAGLWSEFETFRADHPEFNFSGWVQKQMQLMLERIPKITCDHFHNGYCQSEATINECSLLKYGKCHLKE